MCRRTSIELTVSDNGPGIAAAERDKVADRLTPEQLQEGKDALAAYLASHEGQVEQVAGEK